MIDMFEFFDTILYFILGVILVLIILHNLSNICSPIYENMKGKRKGKKPKVGSKKSKQKQEDEYLTLDVEQNNNVATNEYTDDDGPIPNYSEPIDENTIDNMQSELDKEVILEPHEIENIDYDDNN